MSFTSCFRLGLCLALLVSACDCGGEGDADAGAGFDGGADFDGGPDFDGGEDAGPGTDGGPVFDGGPDFDGGPPVDAGPGTDAGCVVTSCGGRVTECSDCVDNDGDGRRDSADPECLGPCDNTEGSVLLAGVGGEAGGPCMSDCYFDFGNGSGNDDCFWDHRCDPLAVPPRIDPEGGRCIYDEGRVGGRTCPDTQSEQCTNFCEPLTPNGCDCFGCCTFDALAGRSQEDGGEWVWIGSRDEDTDEGSCTLADVTNRDACRSCTPVMGCFNDCGPCELCIGRDTLPPECFPPGDAGPGVDAGPGMDAGTPPPRCEPGVQACGLPGDAPCGEDFYCVTGCCQSILI